VKTPLEHGNRQAMNSGNLPYLIDTCAATLLR
jgi:hypothetical protein